MRTDIDTAAHAFVDGARTLSRVFVVERARFVACVCAHTSCVMSESVVDPIKIVVVAVGYCDGYVFHSSFRMDGVCVCFLFHLHLALYFSVRSCSCWRFVHSVVHVPASTCRIRSWFATPANSSSYRTSHPLRAHLKSAIKCVTRDCMRHAHNDAASETRWPLFVGTFLACVCERCSGRNV